MKRLIIIVSVIFLIGIVLHGVYFLFLKRTPESLLKTSFNISLNDFYYTIETFNEQWFPNGNGHVLVIYKFNKLTKENIDYLIEFGLQPLPVSEIDIQRMSYNKIPKEYFISDTGYYVFLEESVCDKRDYKFFLVDTKKKIAVLYYQNM